MKLKRGHFVIPHPNGNGLIHTGGYGSVPLSVYAQGIGGPALPVLPRNPMPGQGPPNPLPPNLLVPGPMIPGVPVPVPAVPPSSPILNPLQGVGDAIRAAMGDLLSAGEVLAGVALLVVGLLLATGLLQKGGQLIPAGRALRVLRAR